MDAMNARHARFALFFLLVSLVVFTASAGQGLAQTSAPVSTPPGVAVRPIVALLAPLGEADREAWEWEVVLRVNQERASNGNLPPLKRNAALDNAAYGHSQDMGMNDFFSHTGSNGSSVSDRVQAAGYGSTWVGENIAAGYGSPQQVMEGWMNSPGHRANILNTDYREIGVGYYFDAADTYPGPWGYQNYWTQNFGRRTNFYPVIINSEAYSTTDRTVQLYVYGPNDAQQIRFSNDGTNWSAWQAFNAQSSWTLAEGGSGTRTVRSQVTAGTETYQAEDDIRYVTTAPPQPVLQVSPTAVTLLTQQGSGTCTPTAWNVQVSNTGGGTLDWDATENSNWFDITKSAGSFAVTCVGGAVSGFTPGTQASDVTVTATGAQNSPQTVSVTLVVSQEVHGIYLPYVGKRP